MEYEDKNRVKYGYSDFTKVMAKRKDGELIRIVTFDKNDYQPLAVTAAEEEIKRRNIDPKRMEELTKRLKKKIAKEIAEKEEIERPKSIWEWLGTFVFYIIEYIFWPIFLLVGLLIFLLQKLRPNFGDDNMDDDDIED